jgi:hypothetical protein
MPGSPRRCRWGGLAAAAKEPAPRAIVLQFSSSSNAGGFQMSARLLIALLWCAVVLSAAAQADDNSASVERAKKCDAMTQGKGLSEEQYRAYMSSCLVSEGPPRDPRETARTIEKRCNTIANERQLNGQDRVLFMQTCRTRG